jgi:hypothetical protein
LLRRCPALGEAAENSPVRRELEKRQRLIELRRSALNRRIESNPHRADDPHDGEQSSSCNHRRDHMPDMTDDERGMAWWNSLSDDERAYWMRKAGNTGVARDAWRAYKAASPPKGEPSP